MTLETAPAGVPLRLQRPDLPLPARRRLAELGLRPGSTVTVLHRTAGGGRVVGVGEARVAVAAKTLRRLPVQLHARPHGGEPARPAEG